MLEYTQSHKLGVIFFDSFLGKGVLCISVLRALGYNSAPEKSVMEDPRRNRCVLDLTPNAAGCSSTKGLDTNVLTTSLLVAFGNGISGSRI